MCAVDPVAHELMLIWHSRVEAGRLTEPLPSQARDILLHRKQVLGDAFREQGELDPVVDRLLSVYPYQRRAPLCDYVYVLNQTIRAPLWSVIRAVDRFLRGEEPKSEFVPNPGRLRAIAWHVARPFWIEGQAIGAILMALPPREDKELAIEDRRAIAARILADYRKAIEPQRVNGHGSSSSDAGLCERAKRFDFPDF